MSAYRFSLAVFSLLISGTSSKMTVHEYTDRIWYTASLTPYEVIGNLNESPIIYPGYEPVKLWFVGRHGTRYPEKKTIEGMFNALPKILLSVKDEGNKCFSEELKTWTPPTNLGPGEEKSANSYKTETTPDTETSEKKAVPPIKKLTKSITLQGKTTMEVMGKRFREKFGDFIPTELDSRIELRFTKTLRTRESAVSFVTGLNGKVPPEDSPCFQEVNPPDYALKFGAYCWFWKKYICQRPEWLQDFDAFKNGPQMNRVLTSVKERCKLPGLDRDTLMDIYMMCSYELAWYDKSPWCQFFEGDEQEILEYNLDLKYFNQSAYSNEWNYKIACPMLKQMFEFLTTKPEVPVRFNFSHLATMLKFTSHLGLFPESKNEWLTGRNYKKKTERKWASSTFAGFSFNLTFVLFKSENEEKFLLFMLNEKVVKIPGCPQDTDLCPLETFKTIFDDSINRCEYEKWCMIENWAEEETSASQTEESEI